ncbi:hypothetical protein D6853_12200 [Butyrivibrio sp. X503]|uniref:type II secretion system F family protein n=1 Tax=Butyrivibrio sp. X503 TaxID=2364878 RepID=UPI000EAAB4E9|nr:type II secretion system F family protein [Butyrivibrio sp. X503]RKM54986.1 hypothetical protein D6853_12200 [Butyrivibrio sp. X503]
MIFLYLAIPVSVLIIWFISKEYELPEGMEETGITREILKVSLFIFNKLFKNKMSFAGEKVRGYLKTLNDKRDIERVETEYYIRKISIVILMALAGSFLSILMYVSQGSSIKLIEGKELQRNEGGDGDYTAHLIANDESGKEIGRYDVSVKERVYTKEETDALFESASKELEREILLENESLERVESDLNLPEKLEGYPFIISWSMDNYELIHYDGRLEKDLIPKEGAVVTLTAKYKYDDYGYSQVLCANLVPRELSPSEQIYENIRLLIKQKDEESVNDESFELPENAGGETVNWSEHVEDNSLMILVITLIGGAASYVLRDKELKRGIENRASQMLSDYPQLVSRLALYLGAGMTMRNIFERLASVYANKRAQGAPQRYVYEEMLRTVREMAAGVPEAVAYENFGLRCQNREYTRLSALLSQNLRKGNSEMLKILQEESKKAFEERMDRVRKLGEEAGTRLLLPMIMMLVIVMVIIMIPAYMSF